MVLTEGSVPTVVFGAACLGSLATRRPLMFGFSLEFIGPDTPTGREMTNLWQYEKFRRIFRIITIVWGVGFLLEAALRVVIVYNTSTGTAMASVEGHAVYLDSRVDGVDGGIRPVPAPEGPAADGGRRGTGNGRRR